MAEPGKRRLPKILPKDFGISEFKYTPWSAVLQEGYTIEDTLQPDFWAMVSQGRERSIKPGDLISVRHVKHLFYALLYVVDANEGWANVEVLEFWPIGANADDLEDEDPDFTAQWRIATKTWDVVRRSDNAVMVPGLGTKKKALTWIRKHRLQTTADKASEAA